MGLLATKILLSLQTVTPENKANMQATLNQCVKARPVGACKASHIDQLLLLAVLS